MKQPIEQHLLASRHWPLAEQPEQSAVGFWPFAVGEQPGGSFEFELKQPMSSHFVFRGGFVVYELKIHEIWDLSRRLRPS